MIKYTKEDQRKKKIFIFVYTCNNSV
ncbi:hypothetical protein AKJ16_DCAP22710 [Drosera capensis]